MKDKKVLIIGMAALIIALTIVGIVLGMKLHNNKNKVAVADTYTYDVGQIFSNLKDSHRIIKCNISVEVIDDNLLKEFENHEPKTKDTINKILRNKSEKDVEGMQGQINLQKEIKQKLQEIFNTINISNIYFKEFIVQ